MFNFWLAITAAAALTDWVAAWRKWKRGLYAAKPAVLIAMLLWFTRASGWQGDMIWFGLGLVFSLLGDVALLLPSRYFLPGVAAFFLAHVAYLVGFNLNLPVLRMDFWLLLALTAVTAFSVFRRVLLGLRQKSHSKPLVIPLVVYAVALSLMWLSALVCMLRPGWPPDAALLAAMGGTLFFTSDCLLSYNRFVRPLRNGQMWVHITYHIGQACIVLAALLWQAGFPV